jgi:hypothetical protein
MNQHGMLTLFGYSQATLAPQLTRAMEQHMAQHH